MLFFKTNLNKSVNVSFLGFSPLVLTCSSICPILAIPSSFGILVYSEVTSKVPIMLSGNSVSIASTFLMKSEVSFTNDLLSFTIGFIKMSTKADILSVGQLFADTMGLPGGCSLWIFGRK